MFDSLKKKFTNTIGKISERVSKEAEEEAEKKAMKTTSEEKAEKEIEKPSEKEQIEISKEVSDDSSKKSFFTWPRDSSSEKEVKAKNKEYSPQIQDESPIDDEKSIFLSFIRERTISEKDVEDILWELEMSLLESDVALEVAEKIIKSVKENLVGKKIKRRSDVAQLTKNALKKAISEILDVKSRSIRFLVDEKKSTNQPLILMFVGINGTGKTTTIAKIATYFIKNDYHPVIAASDTFRAGAIEQLTHHADKIGVKIIKHKKGADPAAVAFDAVSHAKAKFKDVVLVDTAGRMQTNVNLMDEMKKIKRVISPDLILFVGDALTGNDAVEQALKFNDAVGIDGIILTKADADSKGGAALSIGYVIKKPIMFLGTGQSYDDIMEFNPDWMVEQIIGS
ncbi:MAG: signal recognition particle-docking protein FtsY [Methanobacteriaceae archaeon]